MTFNFNVLNKPSLTRRASNYVSKFNPFAPFCKKDEKGNWVKDDSAISRAIDCERANRTAGSFSGLRSSAYNMFPNLGVFSQNKELFLAGPVYILSQIIASNGEMRASMSRDFAGNIPSIFQFMFNTIRIGSFKGFGNLSAVNLDKDGEECIKALGLENTILNPSWLKANNCANFGYVYTFINLLVKPLPSDRYHYFDFTTFTSVNFSGGDTITVTGMVRSDFDVYWHTHCDFANGEPDVAHSLLAFISGFKLFESNSLTPYPPTLTFQHTFSWNVELVVVQLVEMVLGFTLPKQEIRDERPYNGEGALTTLPVSVPEPPRNAASLPTNIATPSKRNSRQMAKRNKQRGRSLMTSAVSRALYNMFRYYSSTDYGFQNFLSTNRV